MLFRDRAASEAEAEKEGKQHPSSSWKEFILICGLGMAALAAFFKVDSVHCAPCPS
jgi:hypothetical protein